jgi:hypothetical protein
MLQLGMLVGLIQCKRLVVDRIMNAAQAGDYTLVMSAGCNEVMPGRGADICRVQEGMPVKALWNIVIPGVKPVLGGTIEVTYRDISKTYPILGNVVSVPLSELVGETWEQSDDGIVLALAQVRYQGNEVEEVTRARGILFLVVTDKEYAPMPIDSGFEAFKMNCKVDYSTAGRSALDCK